MAKDKISMPSSTAGITRYFDDYKSKIEFKPGHIIILICIIIIVEIILKAYGAGLFGL
ncbi:preprotein translocase subunit Sec61beta [Candidatus Woesearchaeota archaeon]|nr:preprotein translocase subunit Sec61beta [Candidatus Woesearchaeota archaeon]